MEPVVAKLPSFFRHKRLLAGASGIGFILFLVAAIRLAIIGKDPPYWLEQAFIADIGWWVASARGKVFFGDHFSFSGDFGSTYLLLPAYTWILEKMYSLWGVGLVQTQVLAMLSNFLVVVIGAILAWRMAGLKEAAMTTVLLGLSPFFWPRAVWESRTRCSRCSLCLHSPCGSQQGIPSFLQSVQAWRWLPPLR
jgi:hypothetical protein